MDRYLLESLNYKAAKETDENNSNSSSIKKPELKTALHLAVEAKNTRIINLLLSYISKLEIKNDYVIRDIFKLLIKQQGF